jgi:4a-hydroxytetrahydrobiopterin dehydratase
MTKLASRQSAPRKGPALSRAAAAKLLKDVPKWKADAASKQIRRTFSFKNYYETMAFVNAVAWIAHGEDHHPDMTVGYNKVTIVFSTHSVGGLSENDFISAAKIDGLGGR